MVKYKLFSGAEEILYRDNAMCFYEVALYKSADTLVYSPKNADKYEKYLGILSDNIKWMNYSRIDGTVTVNLSGTSWDANLFALALVRYIDEYSPVVDEFMKAYNATGVFETALVYSHSRNLDYGNHHALPSLIIKVIPNVLLYLKEATARPKLDGSMSLWKNAVGSTHLKFGKCVGETMQHLTVEEVHNEVMKCLS